MKNIDKFSARDLASQMVFPRVSADLFYSDAVYKKEMTALAKAGVGGFCVFSGGLKETENMIGELQAAAEVPLLFCADFEHGLPMRLNGGTAFPHAMALGRNPDTVNTYNIAAAIAEEAKSIGIYWNLAPVCDVNSNKDNPIINIRSFGESADVVVSHSAAYIKGLQDNKVLGCAKHFPGHGDTDIDSHLKLPVLSHSEDRINSLELKPFISAINSGVKSIMAGHLSVPALDSSGLPASLSHEIITGILRNKLGYRGLIVTDALDMKAISDSYSSARSAVMAARAGCDVILLPPVPAEAIDALENEALADNDFLENLKSSVSKLLKEKRWCGLIGGMPKLDYKRVPYDTHERLALQAAHKAINIEDLKNLVPLPEDMNIAGFAFIQGEDMDGPVLFFKILAQAIENDCDFAFIDENITDEEIQSLKDGVLGADMYLFAFFYKSRAYFGNIKISKRLRQIIDGIAGTKPVVSVLFGNPYLRDDIPGDAFVSTYTDSLPGIAASIITLSGRSNSLDY